MTLPLDQGFRSSLQISSAPLSLATAQVLEVVRAGVAQIERAGPARGDLTVPEVGLALVPPPPLAGFAKASAAVAGWQLGMIAGGWVALIPGWSHPFAWGLSAGLPLASLLAWDLEGRPTSWIPLLAIVGITGLCGVASLAAAYHRAGEDRRRERRQAALDERRAEFRGVLLKELRETPMSRFDFPGLVARAGFEPSEAEAVADEVYGLVARKVVADGIITGEERARLTSLAGLLHVHAGRAGRIESLAKKERYEQAYAEAAEDGVFTDEEIRGLDELRKSLGLGSEIAIPEPTP